MSAPVVAVIGGGMIVHDQILPSLYHLQRRGIVGEIRICARHASSLRALAGAESLLRAFPGQSFRPFPDLDSAPGTVHENLYREVLAAMPPRSIAVIAVPDQLHHEVIMAALRADQHVLSVKPLVLKVSQSVEIEHEAARRSLLVAIEYHKRFDDRSLMARRRYREGWFGEFRLGAACLLEKWYYRHSNFQNWCTTENSDAFAYIGCHYVDLVHFITGLTPVAVGVYGIRGRYPNGNEGFLWTDARVLWNNGACLNVQNALGFPDDAPGTNTQGLTLYCAGGDAGGLLSHSDQYRGLQYSYLHRPSGAGATVYAEPSPDYFQYVDLGGPGLTPVGYGYRSIEHIVETCLRVEQTAPADRPRVLREIDDAALLATPANSRYNEKVLEAGRLSILNGGREVAIDEAGK
ncbi:MAG: Gfo/Idh/MocA family oxidoreductase [Bryobacteraceae bacterium]